MTRVELNARFVTTSRGNLLLVTHGSTTDASSCVLIVPPFGDEMNKSRHLLTQAARAIAKTGVLVILPDLFGTGDSDGEFRDATWQQWISDLHSIGQAVVERGMRISGMIAMRTGALLGLEAAQTAGWPLERIVLWQPVTDGARFLTQILRVGVAASMSGENRVSVESLRRNLSAGDAATVAGYELSPALAKALDQASIGHLLNTQSGAVCWIEVTPAQNPELSPAAKAAIEQARQRNRLVVGLPISGQPFWSSAEIVQNPLLVQETVRALSGAAP